MPKLEKGSESAKERMSVLRAMRKPKGVVPDAPVPVDVPVVETPPVPVVVPDTPVVIPDAGKTKKTRVKKAVINENIIVV